MVHWCAYCQKFLREFPPYDDFSFSHGMCEPCAKSGLDFDEATEAKMQNLVSLQRKIWKLGSTGDMDSAIKLIDQSLAQGARAADLLLGIIGSTFYRTAKISGNSQHLEEENSLLNEFCIKLVAAARIKFSSRKANNDVSDVLLFTTNSNPHSIGVQLLELWLNSEGISSLAFVNNTSTEIITAIEKFVPKAVGFSISQKEQLNEVRILAKQIRIQFEPAPLLLLGGYPVKTELIKDDEAPEFVLVPDESKLFLMLKTHLSLGFLYELKKRSSK